MKKILLFSALFIGIIISTQAQDKELAIYLSPIEKITEPSSYKLLFRNELNSGLTFRIGLSADAQMDKEVRSDSLTYEAGHFAYTVSAGLQKDLSIGIANQLNAYVGADLYYASEFNQKAHETYYGYYWNFGMNPLVGLRYEPSNKVRISLETLGDLNVNLQEYSAPGTNEDSRFRLHLVDRLGLSIGYLF